MKVMSSAERVVAQHAKAAPEVRPWAGDVSQFADPKRPCGLIEFVNKAGCKGEYRFHVGQMSGQVYHAWNGHHANTTTASDVKSIIRSIENKCQIIRRIGDKFK